MTPTTSERRHKPWCPHSAENAWKDGYTRLADCICERRSGERRVEDLDFATPAKDQRTRSDRRGSASAPDEPRESAELSEAEVAVTMTAGEAGRLAESVGESKDASGEVLGLVAIERLGALRKAGFDALETKDPERISAALSALVYVSVAPMSADEWAEINRHAKKLHAEEERELIAEVFDALNISRAITADTEIEAIDRILAALNAHRPRAEDEARSRNWKHDCEDWRDEGVGCAKCNSIAREIATINRLCDGIEEEVNSRLRASQEPPPDLDSIEHIEQAIKDLAAARTNWEADGVTEAQHEAGILADLGVLFRSQEPPREALGWDSLKRAGDATWSIAAVGWGLHTGRGRFFITREAVEEHGWRVVPDTPEEKG